MRLLASLFELCLQKASDTIIANSRTIARTIVELAGSWIAPIRICQSGCGIQKTFPNLSLREDVPIRRLIAGNIIRR